MRSFQNNQEYFDHVWNYFSAPDAVRALDKGLCAYRTPEGRGCAIGCAIPDAIYGPIIEGRSAHAILLGGYGTDEIRTHFKNVSFSLLEQMQHAHDETRSVEGFLHRARSVGKRRNLTVPGDA